MELTSITGIRNQYLSLLGGDDRYAGVMERLVQKQADAPLLTLRGVEAESDLSYREEQRQMSEILLDLYSVNNGIAELKDGIQDTIRSLDASLDTILLSVQKQREQAEDASIICGASSEYSTIIPVYTASFPDAASETVGIKTLGTMPVSMDQVAYDIVSISGNGYSGNAFVYLEDGTFQNQADDYSAPEYIIDNNTVTVYEYSRISTKNRDEALSGIINYDSKSVECVLTLHAEEPVSKAVLSIDEPDVTVRKVEISDDGLNFRTCMEQDLRINDTKEIYNSYTYVFGTPVLCFPKTSFLRLTLASDAATQDTIAVEKEDGSIVRYPGAYRKKISIRGIELYAAAYEECTIISDEVLLDCAIDKISLFASEYIPDHFVGTGFITYSLIVNGQEFPIVPVNMQRDGISIIKYSEEETAQNNNTTLIHETIRSVRLKIMLRPYNQNETPYVSNLKLCIGKNTGDIYV